MSIYTWRGSLKRQYTKIAQRYDNRVLRAHLNFKRFLTTFANYQQSTYYVHKMTLVNLKQLTTCYFETRSRHSRLKNQLCILNLFSIYNFLAKNWNLIWYIEAVGELFFKYLYPVSSHDARSNKSYMLN